MDATAPMDEPLRGLAELDQLPDADRSAAEALAAAMSGWDAAELAAYRASVLEECERLRGGRADGFLAAELAALAAVEAPIG